MRVFVAGATGVLGRNLLPLLAREGHAVRALVRSPVKAEALAARGVDARAGDLLAPDAASSLPSLVRGCDAVLHLATAIPRNMTAPGAWDANTRVRTDGTRRLLAAARSEDIAIYVQQSIVMAYKDGGDEWLDESTPLDTAPARAIVCAPVVAMESMVRAIPPDRLRWCILRGGSFVGPDTFQDDLVAELRAGRATVPGDGRHFISPIHVADMASAVIAALDRAPAGSTFHVVDTPIRYGEYADHIAGLLGVPEAPRAAEMPSPPSFRCRNEAARVELGWAPQHGIWPVRE